MMGYLLFAVGVLVAGSHAQLLSASDVYFVGDNGWPDGYRALEKYQDDADANYKWTPDRDAAKGKSGFEFVNDDTYPTLAANIGNSALAVSYMEPCTIDMPHQHPFATELMYVTKGTIEFGFVNPATKVSTIGEAKVGDFFWSPSSVFQFQANYECERAEFLSVFNGHRMGRIDYGDLFTPGVDSSIARNALNIDQKIFDKVTPPGLVDYLSPDLLEACLQRCGK